MQNNQKRNKLLYYKIIMLVSMAFSMAFGLGACKPKPEEIALPFETIEQQDLGSGTGKLYEPREPGMVIISRINEINTLDGMVSDESINQLQTLDYGQYFALCERLCPIA